MSYPMTPSAWLRTACAVVGRDLTRAEWDRYLPGREYDGRPAPTWSEAARRRPRPGGGGGGWWVAGSAVRAEHERVPVRDEPEAARRS